MERISQDVALSILNTLRVKCIKALDNKNIKPEEEQLLKDRKRILAYEEQVIYGLEGDKEMKDVVYDKIERLYSPEVKAIYA